MRRIDRKKTKMKEKRVWERESRWLQVATMTWQDKAVGPISWMKLPYCHWVSVFEFWKHQKPVFIFHHPHPFFWVFESWKQWSKTKLNRWSFVGPIRFGWWIMKTEWYHLIFIPSKQALNLYTLCGKLTMLSLFQVIKFFPIKVQILYGGSSICNWFGSIWTC